MSVSQTSKRKNLPQAERREQILQSALRAFAREGYDATHVEQIVKEAGVGRGTFYLHFKSKHEVFEELVNRMLAVFLAARPKDTQPTLRSVEDAKAYLRETYTAVLTTLHDHRHLAHLFFNEAIGINKGFRKQLDEHYREWHMRIARFLDLLMASGLAREDLDVDVTSEMVIGMVERVARQFLFPRASADIGRFVEALVDLEIGGVIRTPPLPS